MPAGSPSTSRPAPEEAGGALALGAALAAVGMFLPWVRLEYPAIAGDPATTLYITPGPNFALYLRGLVTAPYRFSVVMTLLSLLFFAAPVLFAVVGASVFLRRGWMPTHSVRYTTLIIAVAGTVMTLLAAAFVLFLSDAFAVVQPTRTPLPGASVTLLGYLCALLGTSLLPVRPGAPRRGHQG